MCVTEDDRRFRLSETRFIRRLSVGAPASNSTLDNQTDSGCPSRPHDVKILESLGRD